MGKKADTGAEWHSRYKQAAAEVGRLNERERKLREIVGDCPCGVCQEIRDLLDAK